jgi:hypothetical protein
MTHRNALFTLLFAVAFVAPATGWADDYRQEALDDDPGLGAWDHFELSMGFLAGQRSYSDTPFKFAGGTEIEGAGAILEPFLATPFDMVPAYGLRYDARLVVSYLRMTVGVDIPFAAYGNAEASGDYPVGGVERRVTVQELKPFDLRFGIGAEAPIGSVVPFVDVLGSIHWVDASIAVDDELAQFRSTSFAFSGRGGVRLHVRRWFYATASAEVGIVGDIVWGTELSLGFAFM